jgi:hypothetical protein
VRAARSSNVASSAGADLAQARPADDVAAVIVRLAADEGSGGRVVTLL